MTTIVSRATGTSELERVTRAYKTGDRWLYFLALLALLIGAAVALLGQHPETGTTSITTDRTAFEGSFGFACLALSGWFAYLAKGKTVVK